MENLKTFLLTFPSLPDFETFDQFAGILIENFPTIRAFQFVDRNRIIRHIYPLEGNEPAIGLDLMTRPAAPFVEKAIRERITTVNDPTMTVQGSLSIIARAPLYQNETFLGLIQGVFDIDTLITETVGLLANRFDFKLKDANDRYFWGDHSTTGETRTKIIDVGDNFWTLIVATKTSMTSFETAILSLIWFLGSLLGISLIYILHRAWTKVETLNTAVAQRTHEISKLYDLGKRISATLDPEKIFQITHDSIADVMDCDGFYISSFNPQDELIRCEYGRFEGKALDVSGFPPIPLEPEGQGTQSIAIRTGETLNLADYLAYRSTSQTAYYIDESGISEKERIADEDDQTRSALIVPMKLENRVFGVIQVFSYKLNAYSDNDAHFVESLAPQVAAAMTNANLFRQAQDQLHRRKEAEKSLSLSQKRYKTLFESARDGIVLIDAESGLIVECNQAFEIQTGLPEIELRKKRIWELRPKGKMAAAKQAFGKIKEKGSGIFQELDFEKPSGERIPIEFSSQLVEIQGKLYIQSLTRDITDRKRAFQKIALQNVALEATVHAIIITNHEGIIEWANPAFYALTGFSKEETLGQSTAMLKSGIHDESFYQHLWDTITAGETWFDEITNRRKDGSLYTEEMSITPVKNSEGEIVNFIAFKQDISERKQTEERIQKQLQQVSALHAIDLAITSSLDLAISLKVLLDQLVNHLEVDAADILILDPTTQTLTCTIARGFQTDAIHKTSIRLGEGSICGEAALERRKLRISDLSEYAEGFSRLRELADEGFISFFTVPLVAKGQLKGVLEAFTRSVFVPDEDWLNFLDTLAEQAAIAVDNATLFEDLQRSNTELMVAYDTTLEGWVKALDLRDKETEGHTKRVTDFTVRLAEALGLGEGELTHIRRGALLHDIGKMAIPDSILRKPGKLTDDEWDIMRKHPVYAFEWLSSIRYLRPALDIPYCHHERWDGTGYPRGLKGEEIPLAARIFAVVDVWDALSSDRPYREAWPSEKVIAHLHNQKGSHFDPDVVDRFFQLLSQNDNGI